jgi:hypothetical protein
VGVDHVELHSRQVLVDETHRECPVHQRIANVRLAPEGSIDGWDQPSIGLRVATGKQRDLVTPSHELLGQQRDDSLGASVPGRRNRLERWSDLGDTHSSLRAKAIRLAFMAGMTATTQYLPSHAT